MKQCPECKKSPNNICEKHADMWFKKHYPQKCKCGGKYMAGLDEWASRIRCDECNDYYDL